MIGVNLLRTVAAVALVAGVVGCTSTPDEPEGPTFEAVACPDDVEVLVVAEHTCGFVVPEAGGAMKIFVVSVEPPSPSDLSPVLETGVDLGMTPGYGGLAPIAQRTGRRVVIVALPGTGYSEPSLDCPEVEALGDAADDDALVPAIRACRDRVEADGIDTDVVTPERLGESLYAVMEALDVPRWVVMGHGTTAEAGRRLALAHPDRVDALVLDSAVMASDTDVDAVVAGVAAACQSDRRCAKEFGDVARTWAQAKARLTRHPIDVDVEGTAVPVDEAALERAVRWLVAPSAMGPGLLPAMLAEAAAGEEGNHLTLFAQTLSVAPPLCVGYVPKCETEQRLVIGSTLSATCPTVADVPAWAGACAAWGVPAGEPETEPLVGVPTLALYGAHDPYASPDAIRARLAQLVPDAFLVEQAAGGHNVLGSECPRTVRNDWLAGDVREPPPELACIADPIDFP